MNAEDKANDTSRLTATNSYFKTLFDLVPAKAYFDSDSNKAISNYALNSSSRSADNSSKVVKQHGKLSKRFKLDPSQPTKTSELQQILPALRLSEQAGQKQNGLNGGDQLSSTQSGKKKVINQRLKPDKNSASVTPALSNDVASSKDNNIDPVDTKNTEYDDSHKSKGSERLNSVSGCNSTSTPHIKHDKNKLSNGLSDSASSNESSKVPSPAANINSKLNPDQLREKLRTRIESLQAKRRHGMTAEEFLESKKLRRKESKLKLKQKRKEARKLKLSVQKQAKNSSNKLNGVSEVKPEVKANVANTNGDNSMVFSKFQFSEQAKTRKDKKHKKPASYKELYEKVCCISHFFVLNEINRIG